MIFDIILFVLAVIKGRFQNEEDFVTRSRVSLFQRGTGSVVKSAADKQDPPDGTVEQVEVWQWTYGLLLHLIEQHHSAFNDRRRRRSSLR
jgi:hypothetical protein